MSNFQSVVLKTFFKNELEKIVAQSENVAVVAGKFDAGELRKIVTKPKQVAGELGKVVAQPVKIADKQESRRRPE